MAGSDLQDRVNALVTASTPPAADVERFSPFREDHLERSARLAGELIGLAEDRGPAAAMDAAERSDENPGIVKHAVKLMVTHSPRARRDVAVPAVHAAPTAARLAAAVPAQTLMPVPNPATQPASERVLDWYRQDPRANDHHSHWHIVYPGRPPDGLLAQKRQGALFLSMHQKRRAELLLQGHQQVGPRDRGDGAGAGEAPAVPLEPVPAAGGGEAYGA